MDADDAGRGSYENALVELSQGRQGDAQRRLEALIARYPDSPYADAARAKIVELYTAPARTAQRSQLGVRPEPLPNATAQPWTVEVQRVPRALEQFRAVVGDRVFFSQGSAELGARAIAVLKAQADWLQARPELDLVVEGHADDPGGDEANLALAGRRADAVRLRLIAEGLAAERIRVVSRGVTQPMALCTDALCSAQNRRVISILEDTERVGPVTSGLAARTPSRERPGVPR